MSCVSRDGLCSECIYIYIYDSAAQENYALCVISEKMNFGGDIVFFWPGISLEACTELIIIGS